MSEEKKSMTDAFGLPPLSNSNDLIIHDAPAEDGDSYDMETARQNMHHLLQKGEHALDEMIAFAVQDQQARSFEVVATLIKTLADVNKDLIHLQEKKKQLAIKDEVPAKTVNNNHLHVGSTADLQQLIKTMMNNNKVIDNE